MKLPKAVAGLRGLFVGGGDQASAALRAQLAEAQQSLTGARLSAESARAEHANNVAELIGRDDGGAALAESRAKVTRAEELASDLQAAVAALRRRVDDAEAAEVATAGQDAQAAAAKLLKERTAAFAKLQKQLDAVATSFAEALEVNERAYAALPARPEFRPIAATEGGITSQVETYLFGHTDGKLCKRGMSPHVARQRTDLVAAARDFAERFTVDTKEVSA